MKNIFQIANIALMGFQAFLIPLLIGISDYGKAMLYLSPVYFYQSVFEPVFQGLYGKRVSERYVNGMAGQVSMKAFIFAVCFLFLIAILGISFFYNWKLVCLLFLIGVFYLYSSNVQTYLLFREHYGFVGIAILVSMAGYMFAFLLTGANYLFPLYGNFLFFLILSLTLTAKVAATRSRFVFKERLILMEVLAHISTRAAYIYSGNGLMMLFGILGYSMQTLGLYRLSLSFMNAGRYFNPVPLVSLQKAISEVAKNHGLKDLFRIIKPFFLYSSLYGLILFFGWVVYAVFVENNLSFFYIFLFTPLYLSIQPLSYWLVAKGYVSQQFIFFVVSVLISGVFAFYDVWLSFSSMIFTVSFLVVILVIKGRKA